MGKGQKGKKHSSSPAPDHKHDTNGKLAEDDFPTGPPEPLYSLPERKHQTEEAERRAWLRSLTWLQRLCYQSYRATQALLPLWFLFFVLGCWAVYYDHETVAQWALPIPYLQAKGEQASLLQASTERHTQHCNAPLHLLARGMTAYRSVACKTGTCCVSTSAAACAKVTTRVHCMYVLPRACSWCLQHATHHGSLAALQARPSSSPASCRHHKAATQRA